MGAGRCVGILPLHKLERVRDLPPEAVAQRNSSRAARGQVESPPGCVVVNGLGRELCTYLERRAGHSTKSSGKSSGSIGIQSSSGSSHQSSQSEIQSRSQEESASQKDEPHSRSDLAGSLLVKHGRNYVPGVTRRYSFYRSVQPCHRARLMESNSSSERM